MEFVLGRRILPSTRYNRTPANPHECWIVCDERSSQKRRTEKKVGPKMAKNRVRIRVTLIAGILETPPAVGCRAGIKKPERILWFGVWSG
jgi:hypothetical protein